jgi:hypothetical protein
MNSTSFGELGGRVARVDAGSLRVGWPGAPGCTTMGVFESVCCAQIGTANKAPSVSTAASPLRDATDLIRDTSLGLPKDFIGAESQY